MLSYKLENFDNVGTVIDNSMNPTNLDIYNCYNFIKNYYFPNVDNYTNNELKVLATLRTGLANTFEKDGSEPKLTKACILPMEHSFLYNTDIQGNNIIIPSDNGYNHVLPLNTINGIESPYGYRIDLSQPVQNNIGLIDYSTESNFRDLLSSSYKVMDSAFSKIIQTLSNQVYNPLTSNPQGLSNVFVDYLTIQIPNNQSTLNSLIPYYKQNCDEKEHGGDSIFNVTCPDNSSLNNLYHPDWCCALTNEYKTLKAVVASINNKVQLNNANLSDMNNNINTQFNGDCPKLDGWCGHPGSTLIQTDCDGDGAYDWVCFDSDGQKGTMLSSSSCANVWPNADPSSCPIAFSGAPSATSSIQI
jgi:hypothetical protein